MILFYLNRLRIHQKCVRLLHKAKLSCEHKPSKRSFHSCYTHCNVDTSKSNNSINEYSSYEHERTNLLTTPSTSASLMETIQSEKQNTIHQIDEMLKMVPGGVTRSSIQDEIQSASILVPAAEATSIMNAETGPTGKYEYFFQDSLMLGTRSYKRRDVASGEEQLVFSINFHLEHLGPMSLSVDESYAVRLINYSSSSSTVGEEMKQKVIIRDISAAVDHDVDIMGVGRFHNVEFGPRLPDMSAGVALHSLFFTTCNALGRPNAVHGCVVFGDELDHEKKPKSKSKRIHSRPELVLRDDDAANFVDVQRTKGCDYVAIHSTSKTSNEVHLVGQELAPILVRKRQVGVQYFVDCGTDDDVIIMAHKIGNVEGDLPESLGEEFSVFEERVTNLPLGSSLGTPIIFGSDGANANTFIEDMELFETNIVFYERSFVDGTQRIRTIDRRSGNDRIIPIEGVGVNDGTLVLSAAGNINYHSPHFEFLVESPVRPPVSLQYDFDTCTVLSADDGDNTRELNERSRYKTRRLLVDGEDGTKIPLTIVYDESVNLSGRRPVVLVGYGCYGQNQNLAYDPTLRPLVDRGFVIVSIEDRFTLKSSEIIVS